MTRMRVEIPVRLATLAPAEVYAEQSHTLVVNPPGDAHAHARVANCLPLGTDGKAFLVGLALETPGNVWGVQKTPADWEGEEAAVPTPVQSTEDPIKKKNWPYSMFSQKGEAHPGRR